MGHKGTTKMEAKNKKQIRMGIISSQAFSLYNFRGALIKELVEKGVKVFAIAPDYNDSIRSKIVSIGAVPVDCSMERTGTHLFKDINDLCKLASILRNLQLDYTLNYFIKPVIYGSIAARCVGIRKVFSMVEGLGYVFTPMNQKDTFKKKCLRQIVSNMYKLAFLLNNRVFFLNKDDVSEFLSRRIINRKKIIQISGIGVDLNYFKATEKKTEIIVYILIARIIKEKGINEYIEAARIVKNKYKNVRFLLVGATENKYSAISTAKIMQWVEDGIVEWPGQVSDVREWIKQSNVFVLPSYREGLPRSTQEAMAMGLPIITTDVPGCRETVIDGLNGFLVPAQNVLGLCNAMCRFIKEPGLINEMGKQSRLLCESRFDVYKINRQILEAMNI